MLTACGSLKDKVVFCTPSAREDRLECVKGDREFFYRDPTGFPCAKRTDLEFYITQCMLGKPVPPLKLCTYIDAKTILCDGDPFPAFTAIDYDCTTPNTLDRLVQRCAL